MIRPLKYASYAIVMQEVPDEISIAFNISGCEHKCEECHSKYLWQYTGNYLSTDIKQRIDEYKTLISCVCFMGGEQNIDELYNLCKFVKQNYNIKTCIYSGASSIDKFTKFINDSVLDYIKIGKYKPECGGLDNPKTNQKMFKVLPQKTLMNINSKFVRKIS